MDISSSKQLSQLISISTDIKNILSDLKKDKVSEGKSTKKSKSTPSQKISTDSIFLSSASLVSAISSKAFTKTKVDLFLTLTKSLMDIASTVKISSTLKYTNFVSDITRTTADILKIFNPKNIFQLALIQKILFETNNNIFKKIITGLIDPFSSIKTSDITKIKKMGESIQALGIGISQMTKSLFLLIPLGLASPLIFLGVLTIKSLLNIFSDLGKKSKDIKKGADAMHDIGKALIAVSVGLSVMTLYIAIAGPVVVATTLLFLTTIVGLFSIMGKWMKQIKSGTDSLIDIGKSLILFSSALAILSLAYLLIGPVVLLAGLGLIGLYVTLFITVGQMEKIVKKGENVLDKSIIMGIVGFTLSMILVSLAIKQFGIENLMVSIGLITLIGGIFVGLGALSKMISKGEDSLRNIGKSLIFIGIGIVTLGLSIKLLSLIFKKSDVAETIGIMTGIIYGLSFIYATIGLLKSIDSGVSYMKKIGSSLLLFSLGILAMSLVLKITMALFKKEDPMMMTAIIGGIIVGTALSFVTLALLSKFLNSGSMSLLLIGASIAAFSISLLLFNNSIKKILYNFKTVSDFTKSTSDLIWGIGKSFMLLGVVSSLIIAGGASMLAMSVPLIIFSLSIILLSIGMKKLMLIYKDLNEASAQIGNFIFSLGWSIAKLGILLPLLVLGLASGTMISGTLLLLSAGLMSFSKTLLFLSNNGMLEKNTTTKSYEIKGLSIIDYLYKTISGIGSGGNIIKLMKGSIIIGMISNAVLDIAKSLRFFGKHLDDISGINNNIKTLFQDNGVFSVILSGFVNIAKQDRSGYRKGIRITEKMSSVLSEIAGGIISFAKFEQFPVKIPDPKDPHKLIYSTVNLYESIDKIKSTVPSLLTVLSDVFSSIGEKQRENKNVKKGIKSVRDLGDTLSNIAGGIAAFANFNNFPIQIADGKGGLTYINKDLSDVVPNIKNILIGSEGNNDGLLFVLSDIFGDIGKTVVDDISGTSRNKAEDIKKGIKSITGIGDTLSSIAGGIAAFANFNDFPIQVADGKGGLTYINKDLSEVVPNIKNILIGSEGKNDGLLFVLTGILVDAGEKIKGNKRKIKNAVDSFSDVSNVFNNIISGIVSFMDIEKGIPIYNNQGTIVGYTPINIEDMNSHMKEIISFIPTIFTDLDTNILSKAKDNMSSFSLFTNELEKMSKMGNGLDKFSDSLTKLGGSFIDLNKGFQIFSTSIPSFTLFEKSISTLSKNQQAYGFSKFASSMGVLKTNVNNFDVEKLKLTNSMMNSMAIISKAPEALASRITDTLETSFEELVKAIKDISDSVSKEKPNESITIMSPPTGTKTIGTKTAKGNNEQTVSTLIVLNQIKEELEHISGYVDGLENFIEAIYNKLKIEE